MGLFEEGPQGLKARGSHNVQVRLDGEWVKFDLLVKSLNKTLATAAMASQKAFAEEYAKKVKRNIREGGKRFGYPPNEGEYLIRKQKYGVSNKPLMFGGTMHDSVEVLKNSAGTRWMVGIPEGIYRTPYGPWDNANLQVHEYANVVEKGYSSSKALVPGRPVFSDTFSKPTPAGMGGKSGLSKMIELGIIKRMAILGIRVTKGLMKRR